MMARAGYNPVDMANMFRTIEQQGRGGGPEWMSDHPNPGNRIEYITQEARALPRREPGAQHGGVHLREDRLAGMPPARSSQDVARAGRAEARREPGTRGAGGGSQDRSSRHRRVTAPTRAGTCSA